MMLRIGELARAASVSVQTVRYYEKLGMLRPERRTAAGYREYDGEAALRLRFIKHAQQLGFSLKEIDELLGLRVRSGAACATIERKTRHKVALIEAKMRELEKLKRSLQTIAHACRTRNPTADCPLLELLEERTVEPVRIARRSRGANGTARRTRRLGH